MRNTILASALALLCAVLCDVALIAQDKKKDKAKPAPTIISLSGCVVRSESRPNQFTLDDKDEGGAYRLTGINMSDYVGRRVQIGGAIPDSKRLVIKGGLTPNANLAAQAGAMDPARAAVASAGGSAGPGTVELPEFKVKSVRPVSGGCSN